MAEPRDVPVFVVVPPRVLLLDVAGPIEVLRKANLEQTALRFVVRYIGPSPTVGSSIGLAVTGIAPLPDPASDPLPAGALVIVSGNADVPLGAPVSDPAEDAGHEDAIVAWLRAAIRPGIRLVTICSGALLAARAGLLDGCQCTTHHASCARLKAIAPRALVQENRLYVEDGERLSSAGITAGVDLMLHLLAQMAGHACAIAVARYLVVYLRRGGADPQLSPLLEGRNHIHPAVHRVQDAVAADPARDWTLGDLAAVAATSPRHLSRLFNDLTGMGVSDYVNRMRIALARHILMTTRADMETVAERAGFGSARQFRRAWNRVHDRPPAALRRDPASAPHQTPA